MKLDEFIDAIQVHQKVMGVKSHVASKFSPQNLRKQWEENAAKSTEQSVPLFYIVYKPVTVVFEEGGPVPHMDCTVAKATFNKDDETLLAGNVPPWEF